MVNGMAEDTASKMEFPLDISEKDYIKGSLIVERRVGTLRSTLPVLIFGTVVLTIGLFSFSWFSSWLVPLVLCAFGPLLVLFFFVTEPAAVRKKARQNYPVFQKFMKDARLYLYPDNMRVQAERVVINESYAMLAMCVETPDMFVFIKDRERLLILPKRCIPAEQMENVLAFIRLTFVRKRRFMRGWFL